MKSLEAALFFFICSAAAPGADFQGKASPAASVRVPVLGYVESAPGEVRPVIGLVGASVVGDPLPLAAEIGRVFPAPGRNYALVETDAPGRIGVARIGAEGLGSIGFVAGGLLRPDRVAFSPTGSAAILYSSEGRRLQVIAGLPDAPRIALDTGPGRLPEVAAAAVSDDAAIALAAFADHGAAAVARIGSDGLARIVLNAASVAAIRFLPGAHDAVVADPQANQVVLLAGDSSAARLLAGEAQGVNAPADVETSPDGGFVFLVNSGSSGVLMIDAANGKARSIECGFAPSSFRRLLNSAVAVVGRDGQSVAVLDAGAAVPWAAFAPRAR